MRPGVWLRTRARKLAGRLPPLASPAVPFVLGLLLLAAGCALAYRPAGLIAPGMVLLYVALADHREAR